MGGLALVLAWFGYAVFYHGLDRITGGNDGFVALTWPGKYTPVARDR